MATKCTGGEVATCDLRRITSRNIKVIHAHMHADQHWSDLGIGPLLSLPTLAKLGTTGEVPQTLAHARVELSRMHTCECRASSQHRHASDDIGLHGAHGRVRLAETGVGIRGTNPHLKHALERRQYPLCGCEIGVSPNGLHAAATVCVRSYTRRPPVCLQMLTTARQT